MEIWSDDEVKGKLDSALRVFVKRFWVKRKPDPEVQRYINEKAGKDAAPLSDTPAYPAAMTKVLEVVIDNSPHVIFARITVRPKSEVGSNGENS